MTGIPHSSPASTARVDRGPGRVLGIEGPLGPIVRGLDPDHDVPVLLGHRGRQHRTHLPHVVLPRAAHP